MPALNLTGVNGRQWGHCRYPGKCEKPQAQPQKHHQHQPWEPCSWRGKSEQSQKFSQKSLGSPGSWKGPFPWPQLAQEVLTSPWSSCLFSLLGGPPTLLHHTLSAFRRWEIRYKRLPLILTCNIGDFFYLLKQLSPCCN